MSADILKSISAPIKLSLASREIILAVQEQLSRLGYNLVVDGIPGTYTLTAFNSFKTSHHLGEPGVLGSTTALKLLFDPDADIIPDRVSKIVGCSLKNAQTYLPAIVLALREQRIYSKNCLIAAVATIGTETPDFCSINEIGGTAYFTKMYEGRADLGNSCPGDGARFSGKGLIQLTGRANFRHYGQRLGVDLENHPEKALDPDIATKVLAIYFKERGVAAAADAGDWVKVRKLVNGGTNGIERFIPLVRALQKAIG